MPTLLEATERLVLTFLNQKCRKMGNDFFQDEEFAVDNDVSDLPPKFWVLIDDLRTAWNVKNLDEIRRLVREHHRSVLGAPGDFGYGTPCGDALRNLYDAMKADTKNNSTAA
jgi:hypothetical protein